MVLAFVHTWNASGPKFLPGMGTYLALLMLLPRLLPRLLSLATERILMKTDVGVDTGTDSSSPLNVDRTKTNNSAIMYLYPC